MHDTIALSEECCYGYFVLADILNEKKKRQFRLCGTHGRIIPWIPPAGLEIDVLLAFKTHFTRFLKEEIKFRQQTSLEEKRAHQGSPLGSEGQTRLDPSAWFDQYELPLRMRLKQSFTPAYGASTTPK